MENCVVAQTELIEYQLHSKFLPCIRRLRLSIKSPQKKFDGGIYIQQKHFHFMSVNSHIKVILFQMQKQLSRFQNITDTMLDQLQSKKKCKHQESNYQIFMKS